MSSNPSQHLAAGRIKVGFRQAVRMILPYAGRKLLEQVRSVWLIIAYLILFLWLVLRMPVADASVIAAGVGGVVVGLSFFMEGLLLGLMPLGEAIGLRLPQKSGLPVILTFAFVLGIGATFAEPAIGILKAAGSSVLPWEAPLLFMLLNQYPLHLVYSVALGVGIAVMLGMVRFMYRLSLKPFIYLFGGGLALLTILASLDPQLGSIMGLAWDCGAVTTGPVTVPLVLALGIGICRVVGKAGSDNMGFGVVTLASLLPVLAVIVLALLLRPEAPAPLPKEQFFGVENRRQALSLFKNREDMLGCAFWKTDESTQSLLFEGGRREMLEYLRGLVNDEPTRRMVFGSHPDALFRWAVQKGTEPQRLAVFGNEKAVNQGMARHGFKAVPLDLQDLLVRNGRASAQAIVPLTLFLMAVLFLVIREKPPRADEMTLGISFALIGMMFFSVGIEIGLDKLGNQVGGKLPALFKSVPMADQQRTILDFDRAVVQSAVTPEGEKRQFFYLQKEGRYEAVPFHEAGYDAENRRYTFVPRKGPLFEMGPTGIIVLLAFAFLMGYGATLAEPALNALGFTVEEMTVGTFKKSLLMQSVALGVGVGIALGVAKIVWDLSLAWMLAPPYLLLMAVTWMSTEEFVNIGWDSAGVTTGPVTVPLVLAMGLGIGNQMGVTEGFGILAMASACPILTVLIVGLWVNRQRRADLEGNAKPQGGHP